MEIKVIAANCAFILVSFFVCQIFGRLIFPCEIMPSYMLSQTADFLEYIFKLLGVGFARFINLSNLGENIVMFIQLLMVPKWLQELLIEFFNPLYRILFSFTSFCDGCESILQAQGYPIVSIIMIIVIFFFIVTVGFDRFLTHLNRRVDEIQSNENEKQKIIETVDSPSEDESNDYKTKEKQKIIDE
jgi:hypothetical protein